MPSLHGTALSRLSQRIKRRDISLNEHSRIEDSRLSNRLGSLCIPVCLDLGGLTMAEKACGVSRRLGQRGKGQSGNPLGRTMRQNMSKKRQNAGRNEGRRRADASLACVRSRPGCLPPEISRNEGYEVRFSPFSSPLFFF